MIILLFFFYFIPFSNLFRVTGRYFKSFISMFYKKTMYCYLSRKNYFNYIYAIVYFFV